MRMHLPEGCAGVTHAGRPLAVTDGTVAVPPEAAAELAAHGLVPVVEPAKLGKQPDRRPEPDRRQR